MPFTPAEIKSANSSSGATPQPNFDPNAFTMQAPLSAKSSIGSELENDTGGAISSQFSSGVSQVKESLNGDTSNESLPEKGLDLGAGLASILTSPLAPVFKPIGDAITSLSDKIANIKSLQDFTQNHPEATDIITRVSKDVSNLATIAGTEAGGVETAGKLSDLASATTSPSESPEIETPSGGAGSPPDDTNLNSRIADATPAYDKSMGSNYIKNADGDIVPRVNEAEDYVSGKTARTVNPTAAETEHGTELANIEDYPDKGTALEKGQAVNRAISDEANNMRSNLQDEDKENPLNADAEKVKLSNLVHQSLPEEIQERIGALSPDDAKMVREMDEKIGAPQSETGKVDIRNQSEKATGTNLPKTPAGRYFQKVLDAVDDYDGTREGKLDLRQTIDKAYKTEGGKYAQGTDSQSALQEIHSDIRDAINKDMRDTTQNTDTQDSLDKQSRMYRAKNILDEKAANEKPTKIGQYMDKHPAAKLAASVGTRTGIRLLSHGLINGVEDIGK